MKKMYWLKASFMFICVFVAVGLCWYGVTHTFVMNSDVVNSPIAWHEIQLHDFSVLSSYRPLSDNWLFSIYPIHFFIFKLFTCTPQVLKNICVAQVFLCACVSALICYRITGHYLSFLLLPFLSTLSIYTYQTSYIAHPFSHNVSNLYGLIYLYIYLAINKAHLNYKDVVVILLGFVAALSDPWFLASFMLPLLLLVAYECFYQKKRQPSVFKGYLYVFFIMYLNLISLLFKGLKLLHLQKQSFHLGSWAQIKSNFYWFFHSFGSFFDVLGIHTYTMYVINAAAILMLFYYLATNYWCANKHNTNAMTTATVFIFSSITCLCAAFILGKPPYYLPHNASSSRFLISVFYLITIYLFASLLLKRKYAYLVIFFVLYQSTQTYVNQQAGFFRPRATLVPASATRIYHFLKQHDLHYGFGDFFSSQSLVLSWISNWSILIRPFEIHFPADPTDKVPQVSFAGRGQTFDDWYLGKNAARTDRQFVIIDGGLGCQPSVCAAIVRKKLGNPSETYSLDDKIIYVYPKNILANSIEPKGYRPWFQQTKEFIISHIASLTDERKSTH